MHLFLEIKRSVFTYHHVQHDKLFFGHFLDGFLSSKNPFQCCREAKKREIMFSAWVEGGRFIFTQMGACVVYFHFRQISETKARILLLLFSFPVDGYYCICAVETSLALASTEPAGWLMGIQLPFLSQVVKNTPATFPGLTAGDERTCIPAFLHASVGSDKTDNGAVPWLYWQSSLWWMTISGFPLWEQPQRHNSRHNIPQHNEYSGRCVCNINPTLLKLQTLKLYTVVLDNESCL